MLPLQLCFTIDLKPALHRIIIADTSPTIANATPEDVFTLRAPLRTLYTTLESHGDLFAALSPSTAVQAGTGSSPRKLLDEVWARYGAGADEKGRKPTGSDGEAGPSGTGRSEGRVRRLVDGQGKVSVSRVGPTRIIPREALCAINHDAPLRRLIASFPRGGSQFWSRSSASASASPLMDQADHPVTYLPALLGILGPQLIPLYKAALSGKRIVSAPGSSTSTLYGLASPK